MKADAMKTTIAATDRAQSREDLLALARAIRAEFKILNGHMSRILVAADTRKAA